MVTHQFAIAVDALAVVRVLRVHSLHISRSFGQLSLQRLQVALDLPRGSFLGRERGVGGGGSWGCHLSHGTGFGVDPSLVADHRTVTENVVALTHAVVLSSVSLPSSTTSASTMSSSEPELSPPSPAAPGASPD